MEVYVAPLNSSVKDAQNQFMQGFLKEYYFILFLFPSFPLKMFIFFVRKCKPYENQLDAVDETEK